MGRSASSSCRRGSARAGLAPVPTRTATGWGRLSSSCSTPPSASSFPWYCASDPWPCCSSRVGLLACASGGGIEAPPAHGFKRGLATENSVATGILCRSPGMARPAGCIGSAATYLIFLLPTKRVCARRFPALLIEGRLRRHPEGGERRGVLRRRLVTVCLGRPGTPPARHYDLAARSSLHGSGSCRRRKRGPG